MRLGQLARKLAVRPADIVSFLSGKQITIGEDSNAKVDDLHVEMIVRHFAPSVDVTQLLGTDESSESAVSEPEEKEIDIVAPEPSIATDLVGNDDVPVEAAAETFETGVSVDDVSEGDMAQPEIEVIKAPKVELPGLKVVGKIELPQPKPKTETATEAGEEGQAENNKESEAQTQPTTSTPREQKKRRDFRRDERPRKNPVVAKREREAREAERKREQEAERQKEQRTQNYLKKVKPAIPTKPARLYDDEQVVEMSATKEEPRTVWGKFKKWFWRE